jgi:hypothetical protein
LLSWVDAWIENLQHQGSATVELDDGHGLAVVQN